MMNEIGLSVGSLEWPIPDYLGSLTFQQLCALAFKPGVSMKRRRKLINAVGCAGKKDGLAQGALQILSRIASSEEKFTFKLRLFALTTRLRVEYKDNPQLLRLRLRRLKMKNNAVLVL